MTDPTRSITREPRTEVGRTFVETVSQAVLDPSIAKMLGDDSRPALVALVSVDAIRDAILAIEDEPAALPGISREQLAAALVRKDGDPNPPTQADYREADAILAALPSSAPDGEGLDVERLTEALHHLHSLEFWKWWEPLPDGGAQVRSGTSPDFAKVIAAIYNDPRFPGGRSILPVESEDRTS